jgi:hypothetical protein
MRQTFILTSVLVSATLLSSCQTEPKGQTESTGVQVAQPETTAIKGFYLLNQGTFGGNNASIDHFDYRTGYYQTDFYTSANPNAVMDLGDVGNDLKVYGSKLYAVLNGSNKIEVMHAADAKSITKINIPNVRYLAFSDGYMYATSYAGPIDLDSNHAQRGYVAKIDTATFKIIDTVVVGYQPEEMAVLNGKLYVANSGGYMVPLYERTVSVIDIATFTVTGAIDVALNLHRIRTDRHGNLWVSSRGDYVSTPSRLYRIAGDAVVASVDVNVADLCIVGDSIYATGSEWNNQTATNTVSYSLVDAVSGEILNRSLITDGTPVENPYGIAVNPITKDLYIGDARDYLSQGTLYCFGSDGKLKWKIVAGKLPVAIAFICEEL